MRILVLEDRSEIMDKVCSFLVSREIEPIRCATTDLACDAVRDAQRKNITIDYYFLDLVSCNH